MSSPALEGRITLHIDRHSAEQCTLRWRHNGHDGVSNHQPYHCLPNRLLGCRSKKTSKLRVTGLCAGNSPGPVTRKMFPFDDVIMNNAYIWRSVHWHIAGRDCQHAGPCFDIKTVFSMYGISIIKIRPSHLYNGNSCTGKRHLHTEATPWSNFHGVLSNIAIAISMGLFLREWLFPIFCYS